MVDNVSILNAIQLFAGAALQGWAVLREVNTRGLETQCIVYCEQHLHSHPKPKPGRALLSTRTQPRLADMLTLKTRSLMRTRCSILSFSSLVIVVGTGAGRGVSGFEGRGVCDGSVGGAKDVGRGVLGDG